MYRVLLPVDENEERVERQVETIESLPDVDDDVEAHVLHVYEEIDSPGDEFGSIYIDEINENLEDYRDLPATVDAVSDALDGRDADVHVHELVGDPADSILEAAEDLDADIILMGVRDRSPIGKVVFGSVSQKVILGSDAPVIISR